MARFRAWGSFVIKLREFGSRLSALIHKFLIDDDWESHFAVLKWDHAEIIAA